MAKFIILPIIIVMFMTSPAFCEVPIPETYVQDVMQNFGCTRVKAISWLNYVSNTVSELEMRIQEIASGKLTNPSEYINETITRFFENESSTVHVTSKYRNQVKITTIRSYLENLCNMGSQSTDQIHIIYDPSYLAVGRIETYEDNYHGLVYRLSAAVFQIFAIERDRKIIYDDVTRKIFGFMFYMDAESRKWLIKIDSITASPDETYDSDYLRSEIQK